MSLRGRLTDELAFWWFYLPRGGVQALARHLPLARLRDALPAPLGARLRLGLYPARVTDARAADCARAHPPWGDPATLDPARPVAYADPPRASVLLVTYNNLSLTRLCLASLQRFAGQVPFEIIAVDNASTDGTPAHLAEVERSALVPLRAIGNAENRGFAAANNQAARLARGDVLVLLNNDTIVTPGWLDTLVAHLDADPALGLLGPVTNSCGNEAEVPLAYATIAEMLAAAATYTEAHAGVLGDLPMLTLFCTAVPRAVWDAVGGLDEGYGTGLFEDDDLSFAVRRAGKRLALCRDVFIHHFGGAAFSRLPPRQYLRLWWQNHRRFEQKWRTTWTKR
jgi:GT2 family glycosyltransferase